MQAPYWSDIVNRELSQKAKLIYGHDWINEIADTSEQNVFPPQSVWVYPSR